jgi:hypothetical protein
VSISKLVWCSALPPPSIQHLIPAPFDSRCTITISLFNIFKAIAHCRRYTSLSTAFKDDFQPIICTNLFSYYSRLHCYFIITGRVLELHLDVQGQTVPEMNRHSQFSHPLTIVLQHITPSSSLRIIIMLLPPFFYNKHKLNFLLAPHNP